MPANWSGKRTDRIQLRMPEDVGQEIRRRADLQHRRIEDQALHLIVIGLKYEVAENAKGIQGDSCPPMAPPVRSGQSARRAKGAA